MSRRFCPVKLRNRSDLSIIDPSAWLASFGARETPSSCDYTKRLLTKRSKIMRFPSIHILTARHAELPRREEIRGKFMINELPANKWKYPPPNAECLPKMANTSDLGLPTPYQYTLGCRGKHEDIGTTAITNELINKAGTAASINCSTKAKARQKATSVKKTPTSTVVLKKSKPLY